MEIQVEYRNYPDYIQLEVYTRSEPNEDGSVYKKLIDVR
jgi:hypothetical protein